MPRADLPANFPAPSAIASRWGLDAGVVHLNHGAFGGCPTAVLDAQRGYIDRMERDGVTFFVEDASGLLDRSREAIAPMLGCAARDLVFVPNATHGVHAALHNIDLGPGDELLVNAHEYPACLNNARAFCERTGAALVVAELPWPVPDADALADAVLARVTERTRVCLLSSVTSPSAVIMPTGRICETLRARGIEIILDAAHGVGFQRHELAAWDVGWATGNAHKWLCSPKGSAWLYVRPDLQPGFRPPILSNSAPVRREIAEATGHTPLHVEFDYVGTRDISAFLAIADAVGFLTDAAGSIDAYIDHNRALARAGRGAICRRLGVEPPVPDALTGATAAITLPTAEPAAELKQRLYDRWRIQVPVWEPRTAPSGMIGIAETPVLRISANLYNAGGQYEYLAGALAAELGNA